MRAAPLRFFKGAGLRPAVRFVFDEAQRVEILGAVCKPRVTDIVNGIRALLRHESFFCQSA